METTSKTLQLDEIRKQVNFEYESAKQQLEIAVGKLQDAEKNYETALASLHKAEGSLALMSFLDKNEVVK